jgi:hypothetical protein
MIQFNCHCSFRFEVPQDQAGGLIQCPQCGRLNDVPLLSDIENLDDEGIYKLDDVPENPHQTFEETHRVYTRGHVDESTGEEIDLRPSADEILSSGASAPIDLADEAPPAPKYDPETGELIEPLAVQRNKKRGAPIDASKIPVARRALNYADGEIEMIIDSLGKILAAMLTPMNVFVLLVIMSIHILMYFIGIVAMAGMFLMVPVLFIMLILMVSHFGCVIDETGPTQNNELPRPLRNLGWYEDLWGPGFHIILAMFICYWPLWLIRTTHADANFVGQALFFTWLIFGTVFLPSTILTTVTSGAIQNVRPDRIYGTAKEMGSSYVVAVVMTILSLVAYGAGNLCSFLALASMFKPGSRDPIIFAAIGLPLLALGIFLIHGTAWYLGLQYRRCHHIFPWILQRHESTRKDTARILEARRREQMRQKQLEQNRPDRDQRLQELRNPPPPPTRTR